MPNWVEGNIRLRGKRNGIADFLKNELMFVATPAGNILGSVERELVFHDDGEEITLSRPDGDGKYIWPSNYIKDTRRNFIDGESISIYPDNDPECVQTVCIDGFKAAWGIDPAPYLDKARKYSIDIRIVGFERGMQFMQTIEIVNGEIVTNEEKTFDDWDWDCPMPNMGG